MREIRDAYVIFVGKPETKRHFGKPRRRYDDNIRMYLREMGWEVVDWMYLAQDRDQCLDFVNTVMNLRAP
jgi:hypothetical protein